MLLEKRKIRQRRKIKMRNYGKLPVLMVFKSEKHIYGQIIDQTGKILIAVGSKSKNINLTSECKGYNVAGAQVVGRKLGETAKNIGITKVVFDRSGYKFHGRVKAFADAARENLEI